MSEAVTNCIVHAYAKKNGGEENAEDKILIECAIECKDGEDGGVLHIDITDYGCGIGNVEQAMQPFFTTLSDDERSGMGFTIMQTFMTEFSVTSEEGKGTKVRMSKKSAQRTRQMLDEKDTIEYIRRAKRGDQSAKQILIDGNVSLIKCIVKRYLGKGVEYDDLFQLACMGFLKAITGFDESFGVRFSTYAVPMIAGEIKRFMRDDGSVKVSRAMKQTAKEMNTFVAEYTSAYGRQPAVKEIAEKFGLDESETVFVMGSSKMPVSIYGGSEYKDGNERELIDTLPAEDKQEEIIDKLLLRTAIESLPERDRKIIVLRYFRDMTQSEVAEKIGVSQVQVSRIESRIIKEFRQKLIG